MSGLAVTLIAVAASAAYATGWFLAARVLYAAWRPSRVPLCKGRGHVSNTPGKPARPDAHDEICYRRRKLDGSITEADTDNEAAVYAMFMSLLWPVIALGLVIRRGAPQLQEEKDAHIRDLEAANDRLRAELDAGGLK